MALPQHNFQHNYNPQQHQQSQPLRNFLTMDSINSPQVQYYDPSNFHDQSQHPPHVPTFHVVGFAPETAPVADGNDMGVDLQWNNGLEAEMKMPKVPKEHEFFQNNSQMYKDLLPSRPVSTGLGLSLYNTSNTAVSGDSALLYLLGDDIDRELRQQDAEMDRFLKIQGERLRQAILDKVQASNLQILSYVEQKALQKLHEKEAEIESINKRNMDLEARIEELTAEGVAWQQRAIHNENMINTLKFNIQQVYAQNRDSKEGCGDSGVDDTASCCNGFGIDFQLPLKENNITTELMTCKVCRVNRVSMILLPCRHFCLCNECESKLSYCPLCMLPKSTGMKVYM